MRGGRVFKSGLSGFLRLCIAPVVLSLFAFLLILSGLERAERSSARQGVSILEQSLKKAAVRCYAIEGAYPCDISYIETHYGVRVDRSKYAVHYDIFAANVMPDISVIALKEVEYE